MLLARVASPARLSDVEVSTELAHANVSDLGALRDRAPTQLRSQIISDMRSWDIHRDAIDQLLSTTSLATPHSTTAWQQAWWKSFAEERCLRIGLWWDGRELVGYAPLMLTKERAWRVTRRVLRFIGDGISDYADLFGRDDRRDVVDAMVKDIIETWDWEELHLTNVRDSSATIAAFQTQQSSRYFSRVRPIERCLHIDLRNTTFERYYRSLSRNHRRELQKRRHKLDALGNWNLRFEADASPESLFDEFRALHTARSETMGWTSLYDFAGFREFFATLLHSPRTDIEVLCSTLRHEQRLMSYTLGFVHNGVYYHWNIGFDSAYEAIAPNKLHHQFLIEECFRRGYVAFDFMRGAYDYKFKWTDSVRENYGIRFLRRHGWQRAVNSVLWLQEREPDSMASRLIDGTRAALRVLSGPTAKTGEGKDSADLESAEQ